MKTHLFKSNKLIRLFTNKINRRFVLILAITIYGTNLLHAQTYPFTLPPTVTASLDVATNTSETYNNLQLGYNISGYNTTTERDFIEYMNPITLRFPSGLWSNWYDWTTDELRVYGTTTFDYIFQNTSTRVATIDRLASLQTFATLHSKMGINGLKTLNDTKKVNQGKGYDMLYTFNMSADGTNFNNGSPVTLDYYNSLKAKGLEVKAIEMGNECFYPGQRSSIIPNASQYISRAKSMSQALKAQDASIKVSIPLLRTGSFPNPTWNADLTADLSYFDAISVHMYAGYNPDDPDNSDNEYGSALIARNTLASAINDYVRVHAPTKPIWLSEWGVQVNGPNAASILGMSDCYLYMAENKAIYERANWYSVNGELNSFLVWETYLDANGDERPRIKEPKQKTAFGCTYEILRSVFENSTVLGGTVTTTELEATGVKAVNAKAVVKDGQTMVFAINMTNKAVVFTLKFNGTGYTGSFKHETMKFTSLSQEKEIALTANPLTIEKQGTGTITLPPLSVNKISDITPPQSPYTWAVGIPGTIQAENYDKGGEDISYSDSNSGNTGGVYRTDNVDIQANPNGYHLAYTVTGEWLEYRINVAETGNYNFKFTYSTPNATAVLGASFPDESITLFTGCTMASTGSWTTFATRTKYTVPLTAGYHTLRLNIEAGGINIDKIELIDPTKSGELEDVEDNNQKLQVSPNPSSNGIFYLNAETNWEVYSLTKIIQTGKGTTIDLSSYSKGIYILKTKDSTIKLIYN